MITFEELVVQTHVNLSEKTENSGISIDKVRSVLESANISFMLQGNGDNALKRRIFVRNVQINGQKLQSSEHTPVKFSYRRQFVLGINGWIAGNSAGKSTILKAIVWALTGVSPSLKSDMRKWITDVAVEFEITDDGIYTIYYQLQSNKPKIKGYIYASMIDSVISNADSCIIVDSFADETMKTKVANFFTSRLGFHTTESVKWQKGSLNPKQRAISWDVYAQALFIGADDYSDFLFSRRWENEKYHQSTLSILLGLDGVVAVSRLKVQEEQAKGNYQFEKGRLEANTDELREKIAHAKERLGYFNSRIAAIDTGESVLVDPDYVSRIREAIAVELQRIIELTRNEQLLIADEQQINTDLNRATREAQILREMIQFRHFFSGIPVDKCPHCEQNIADERVSLERDTGECRVCGSHLQPINSTEQQEAVLSSLDKRIIEIKKNHRHVNQDIRNVQQLIGQAQEKVKQYQIELGDLPRQERAGLSAELRSLLSQKGYWEGQLSSFSAQTMSGQTERLQELQQNYKIYQAAHKLLQATVINENEALLRTLSEQATGIARAFGVRNLDGIRLSRQFEMIVTQSGHDDHYSKMEMSEALRIKIAFHLALLMVRSASGIGRHPSLLIIDAPANGELDDPRLDAIIEGFSVLKENLGEQVQILIATTRQKLSTICSKDGIEIVADRMTLF